MSRHFNHLFDIYHCKTIFHARTHSLSRSRADERNLSCKSPSVSCLPVTVVCRSRPHPALICCYQCLLTPFPLFPFHSPPEKTWSYKCVNHRCVRTHYSNKDEKRTTFLTCSMLCGSQTLWPEPSIKSLIGTNAVSFHLNDVQYKVQTPFKNVENLMESAFSVFVDEVRQIKHASGGSSSDDEPKSSTKSYRESPYSSSTRAGNFVSPKRNLTTVNIYVNVVKTADVHLTLATDECYNITMSSKSRGKRHSQDTVLMTLSLFRRASNHRCQNKRKHVLRSPSRPVDSSAAYLVRRRR